MRPWGAKAVDAMVGAKGAPVQKRLLRISANLVVANPSVMVMSNRRPPASKLKTAVEPLLSVTGADGPPPAVRVKAAAGAAMRATAKIAAKTNSLRFMILFSFGSRWPCPSLTGLLKW